MGPLIGRSSTVALASECRQSGQPHSLGEHSLRALARRWRHHDTEVRHLRRRPGRPHRPGVADAKRRIRHRSRPRRRSSSSLSATTPNESAQRPPWRNSATPARSQHRQDKPAGTASTEAGTAKPSGALPSRHRTNAFPPTHHRLRRTAEGLTKKDIIRCLKRFLAREVYQRVMTDHRARQLPHPAL